MAPVPGIFISYRRSESSAAARALYERLRRRFGEDAVFIDLEGIAYGEDFVAVLEKQLDFCQVMLAVMGRDWLGLDATTGKRRIDDPEDFVRIEVAHALARHVRVVPVLVDRATMPHPADLPEDLRGLHRRQFMELDFRRFDADVGHLIDGLLAGVLARQPPVAPVPGPASGRMAPAAVVAQAIPTAAPAPQAAPIAAPKPRTRSARPPAPAEPVAAAAPAETGGLPQRATAPATAGRGTALAALLAVAAGVVWFGSSYKTPAAAPPPMAAAVPKPADAVATSALPAPTKPLSGLATPKDLPMLPLQDGTTSLKRKAVSDAPAPQAASGMPDITGTYRLTSSTLIDLDGKPLGKIAKGKLVIERESGTVFRVFEAKTISNSGTFDYNDSYVWLGAAFDRRSATGMETLRLSGDVLVRRIRGINFIEDTVWARVTGVETTDQWLDRGIGRARANRTAMLSR